MGRIHILFSLLLFTLLSESSFAENAAAAECPRTLTKLADETVIPESAEAEGEEVPSVASVKQKEILPVKPIILSDLLARVAKKSEGKLLTYFDYKKDREISRSRTRFTAPRFFEELLPPGFSFIDHALIGAMEQGLVKTYGRKSEFVSARVDWDFNGKQLYTNCAIRKTALAENETRVTKSALTSDSKAVIIFVHGGGTATTGHHVAHQMMGHFASNGQDVAAFDQGWHGEMSRENFKSDREYLDAFRALIEQRFSAPGKRIYLVGHSMGALFVDLMMRLYPNDKLFSRHIALSAVPDLFPGGTLEQKVYAMDELQKVMEDPNSGVAPSDIALTKGLYTQGKMSPLGYWFEQMFGAKLDWSIPDHRGADYVKTLFIWARYEWLYRGKEALVEKHIAGLKNATLKTYGIEKNFKGEPMALGHTDIYDFKRVGRNGETAGAIFLDIQEFIEDDLSEGQAESVRFKKVEFRDDSSILPNLIGAYANNLAFREFLSDFVFRHRVSINPEFLKQMDKAAQRIKRLTNDRAIKELDKHPLKKRRMTPEVVKLMRAKASRYQDILAGLWVPEGRDGDWGREQLALLKEQGLEMKNFREEDKKEPAPNIPSRKAQIASKQSQLALINKDLARVLHYATSERLQAVSAVLKVLEDKMKTDTKQLDAGIAAHYLKAFAGGVTEIAPENIEPSEELQKLFVQSDASLKAYQAKLPDYHKAQVEEAMAGNLQVSETDQQMLKQESAIEAEKLKKAILEKAMLEKAKPGAKVREIDKEVERKLKNLDWYIRIEQNYGGINQFIQRAWIEKIGVDGSGGLIGELSILTEQSQLADLNARTLEKKNEALRMNLALRYVNDFYDVREISMADLFNDHSPSEVGQLNSILMPVWAEWTDTWKGREDPPEKTDAY